MWELETISPVKHILRIDDNPTSINKWLTFITVLASLFEAILLPVLISLVWITLYKIKRKMNGSEFRLCMQATHGSVFKLFLDLPSRYSRLSEKILVFIILLFIINLLGKNIPNVMLAQIIGIHSFTKIVSHDMVLFKNDSSCMYTSCTSDLEENFALVLNSTTIEDIMRTHSVKNAYWDSSNNNNTLYAVRAKINTTSCDFTMGFDDDLDKTSSNNMGNETDRPANGRFTGSYSGNSDSRKNVEMQAFKQGFGLTTIIFDRCDIPLNMFYISPNFNSNVKKMAKWLKDSEYHEDRQFHRTCQISVDCSAFIEWKKMQIVGDTPDKTKLLEVNFNNSINKFDELFSTNVQDYNFNGRSFGERLTDSITDKMLIIVMKWRDIIKYQGNKYNYNFLDEYENVLSQSLVSSIQSMMNNINVYVDEIEKLEAPGIWIEMTVLSFVIFFVCSILMFILTTKNVNMLLPLSLLDFGIISNAIFKEGDESYIGWPFQIVYFQDRSKNLVTANEIGYEKVDGN